MIQLLLTDRKEKTRATRKLGLKTPGIPGQPDNPSGANGARL
jgi:hypothetical protein